MSWDENMDLRQTQTAMTRSQSQGSYGAGTGRDVGWEHHIPVKAKIHPGKRITYNVSLRSNQETGPETRLKMRLPTTQVQGTPRKTSQ